MKAERFGVLVYVLVALVLALTAFGLGQVAPGLGVIVAAGGSMAWVACNVRRSGGSKARG